MSPSHQVPVRVEANSAPLVSRAFGVLKARIEERCAAEVAEAEDNVQMVLSVDENLPREAFDIAQAGDAVRIAGGSPLGLLYGIGKFLRTSRYEDGFTLSPWRGRSAPRGSLRGMYFASHFHNWYHEAPDAEITRYVEDLALWGCNAVKICFPFIDIADWDDPEAEQAVAMAKRYGRIVKELGLSFGLGMNNTLSRGTPDRLRATPLPDPTHRRGNSGNPVCPSNPEGHAYIMAQARSLCERLADVGLDFMMYWPYDEGGCACEQCLPWGSNGFLKLSRDLAQLAREYFPNLKTILSTWMFDTPPEGEWEGLAEELAKENDWLDYILADSHNDFPRYPLDVGVPGKLPLLNFPEISMWGNWPWGGVGAHPLPSRFQRLWDQVKHVVQGGFPYSEGIYEDMSKAVVLQFYWDRDQSARSTLKEYVAYEFSPEVTAEVLEIVDLLETAASRFCLKEPPNTDEVLRARELAEAVAERLPTWAKRSWRWEILYLRTVLDHERFVSGGLETPTAEAAMMRLIEIYHCQLETDSPYHHRVRPPLRSAVSRNGEC